MEVHQASKLDISDAVKIQNNTLCHVCYQEVSDGIAVPGFGKANGMIHADCIVESTRKIAEDPENMGLLRHLINYEEGHSPQDWTKDVSGGSADVAWEWTDVNIPSYKIRSLLNIGLVAVIFRTNKSTNYTLIGRQIIQETLARVNQIKESSAGSNEIPSDIFDCIIGYDDIKNELKYTLATKKKNHYLLVGPPATAKSLFLMELGRLEGTYQATGSSVTAAGLTDAFISYEPNILLLDEIDKISMETTAVLLSAMETGDVMVTKYKMHQHLKLDLIVIAAGNTDSKMARELLSRFDTKLYFTPYSSEDFISICRKYLPKCENIPDTLAEYIGQQTWNLLDKDVRTARGIARQIRLPIKVDVDRVVNFRKKYAKDYRIIVGQ